MVGIARSRACKACRARRKKCDEVRPQCGLCAKRGIECEYKADLNIVYVNPGATTTSNNRTSRSPSSTSLDTESDSSPEESLFDLPMACTASALRLHIRGSLLDGYLSSNAAPTASTAWLYAVTDSSITDPVLEDALSALSLACMEQSDLTGRSPQQGRIMYGRTMMRLYHRLDRSDAVDMARSDATLAAIMLLNAYETQTATDKDAGGWFAHAKGTHDLVKLRGRLNTSTEVAQKLYLGSRSLDLIYAIGERKAMNIPSYLSPKQFTGLFASWNTLFDTVLELPAILEQADKFHAQVTAGNAQATATEATMLAYMCQHLESNLEAWYAQFLQSEGEGNEKNLYWLESSRLAEDVPFDSPLRVYTSYIHFKNLDVGEQIILSWACLLLMLTLVRKQDRDVMDATGSTVSLYATDAERRASDEKMYKLATRITQSIEYCLYYGTGAAAISFVGMPMNVAMGYFAASQMREMNWYKLIFARLQKVNPGLVKILLGMAEKGGGGRGFRSFIVQDPEADKYAHNNDRMSKL